MVFDDTVGGANANSWADVTYFKAYHETRYPQLAWITTASDPKIQALLIMAGRALNGDIDWTGTAVDNVQAMTWPRSGMLTRNGFPIATTVIPDELKNAQCELAGVMGAKDIISDNDAAAKGVQSISAGDVSISFQSVNTSTSESVDMILRRLGSEFNYLSSEMTAEARRLLVPSWFNQPTIIRPFLFVAN